MAFQLSSMCTSVGIAVALMFLSSCMSSAREEQLQGSIHGLELKIRDVENLILTRDKNTGEVKQSVEGFGHLVESSKVEMEEFRRQLSLTQGAIDEINVKVSRLMESSSSKLQDVDGFRSEMTSTLLQIEKRVYWLDLVAKYEGTREAPRSKNAPKYKSAADLEKALTHAYSQKDLNKVISLATSVVSSEDEVNDFLETALAFRAEIYFQKQSYERAAFDFLQIVEKFPRSTRRPRALLMLGDCLVYLKQNRLAKSYYGDCVTGFPDAFECKAAGERMRKL